MVRGRFSTRGALAVGRVIADAKKALRSVCAVAVHSRSYRCLLVWLAILSPLRAVPSLLTPWLTQIMIDKAYPTRDWHLLMYVGVGFLSVGVLSRVLTTLSGHISTHVKNRVQYRLSFRVFNAIQRLPPFDQEEHGVGGLLMRADRDVQAVSQSLTQLLPQVATLLVAFLSAVVLMTRLNPGITLVVLAVVPVNYWIIGRLTSKLVALNKATLAVTDEVATFLGETIEGAVITSLFSLRRMRRRNLRRLLRERLRLAINSWEESAFWGQCAALVTNGWAAVFLGAGWYLVFSDRLKLGQAVALGMYIGMITRPFGQLGSLYQSLLMDSVAAGRVLQILQRDGSSSRTKPQKVLFTAPRRYELRGLSFGYSEGRLCLHDVDLVLRAGQTVAIVGPTGGGKSTLLRILCGLEDRYSGRFLIDGEDFRAIERCSYLRHVSWVPQTHFFFSNSIRDNLCPHDGAAVATRLGHCAAALGLGSTIASGPEGYDTRLGEKGIRFSVGQYQKLAALRDAEGCRPAALG